MIQENTKPNRAHYYLTELEKQNKLKAIITQNIDGLHQLSGSKNVFELHGSVLDNYCINCGKHYSLDSLKSLKNYRCEKCNELVKPNIVLYHEQLDENVLIESIKYISKADVLIVGGTTLKVSPTNFLINYFQGKHLILINLSSTEYDRQFNLVIQEKIGEVFDKLKDI